MYLTDFLFKQPNNINNNSYDPINMSRLAPNPVVETFEEASTNTGSLLQSLPHIKHNFNELEHNMDIVLDSDSSLGDYIIKDKKAIQEEEQKRYQATQKIQENKLSSIDKKIMEIENLRLKTLREYNKLQAIQSKASGKKIAVEQVGNSDSSSVLLKANHKCFTYVDPDNYYLKKCDTSNRYQHFKMNPVYNDLSYNYLLTDKVNKQSNVKYPFYTIHPSTDSNQCLRAGTQGETAMLSVEPCQNMEEQRWNKSTQKVGCLTNF